MGIATVGAILQAVLNTDLEKEKVFRQQIIFSWITDHPIQYTVKSVGHKYSGQKNVRSNIFCKKL